MKNLLLSQVYTALALLAAARGAAQGTTDTIVDLALAESDLSTLVTALQAADLVNDLQGTGPFTVFAPTNNAFAHLPDGALDYLLLEENKDTLTTILEYHVAAGEILSDALMDGESIATWVQGESLTVDIRTRWSWFPFGWVDEIFINDSRVTVADIDAANGVIHVIDRVLIPDSVTIPSSILGAAMENGLVALLAAVRLTGLDEALNGAGPFTVFAPTNQAFAQLDLVTSAYLLNNPDALTEILLYHVVEGEVFSNSVPTQATTLQGSTLDLSLVEGDVIISSTDVPVSSSATVVIPDVDVWNGVVHVIDTVLIPPGFEVPGNIVELASSTDELSELVDALVAANLVGVLEDLGPFTVFAPTNQAFTDLPAVPTGDDLINVLLYHVLPGQITSEDIFAQAPFEWITLNGQKIEITTSGESVFVNDAMVTMPDALAVNGVVHIIDQVLIPPPVECHLPEWLCDLLGY